jgi:diketogulonate reductase-like aldo/keto reductase
MPEQEGITTSAGVTMPWLLYGTAWKKERTADLVMQAVQLGFRGIDTACQPKHYNEPMVGQALTRLKDQGFEREALFVQTKFTPIFSQDPNDIPYDPSASVETQIAQSFETSLVNLQTAYVDSLVLHSVLTPHDQLMAAWRAMEAIHAIGGARQLGISNCYNLQVLSALYADAREKPAVVQNRFYPDTGYDARLRHWCSNHGIIYQSFWTLTANPHVLSDPAILNMAEKYGKTPAQVLFRYLNQTGIVPLTGTCSEQHMREDLDLFDFSLSTEESTKLDGYFNHI